MLATAVAQVLATAVLYGSPAQAAPAACDALSDAIPAELAKFDVYSAKDLVYACSDFEGPAGAARLVKIARMMVDGKGVATQNGVSLAAGLDLYFRDGDVNQGKVVAGRDAVLRNFSANVVLAGNIADCLSGSYWVCGSYTAPRPSVESATQALQQSAQKLASLPGTRATVVTDEPLAVTARAGLNVIDVSTEDLERVQGITIEGPEDAVVVLRVQGNPPVYALRGARASVSLRGGLTAASLLVFVPDAPWLAVDHLVLPGTLVAPKAHVTFLEGRIEGGLYAGDINGNAYDTDPSWGYITCEQGKSGGQVNHVPFVCAAK